MSVLNLNEEENTTCKRAFIALFLYFGMKGDSNGKENKTFL